MNYIAIPTGRYRCVLAVALALCLPCLASAQQAPLTGQMLAPPGPQTSKPTQPADNPVPAQNAAPATSTNDIGTVTRQLLALQASGSHAGNALPVLGDEASASYVRYIKSFEHPIPEFFQGTVAKNSGNGASSGTQTGP